MKIDLADLCMIWVQVWDQRLQEPRLQNFILNHQKFAFFSPYVEWTTVMKWHSMTSTSLRPSVMCDYQLCIFKIVPVFGYVRLTYGIGVVA